MPASLSRSPENYREILEVGAASRQILITSLSCAAASRFGIGMAGLSQLRGTRWRRRGYPQTMVLHCLSGAVEVWLRGRFERIPPGTTYIAPAGSYHAYHDADGRGWSAAWCYLTHPVLAVKEAYLQRADGRPLRDSIRHCYQELHSAAQPDLVSAWLAIIAAHARRMCRITARRPSMRALWRTVEAEPAFAWSLSTLAERSGLHGEALRRHCLQEHGCPPMAMVARLRMRVAAQLLSARFGSVASIARHVGYRHPAAFTAAFRRHHGCCPTRLDRNVRMQRWASEA